MQYFLHNIDWAIAIRTDWLTLLFKGFTFVGYSKFMLLVLLIGLLVFNKNMFVRVGLLLTISSLLNYCLKEIIQDPRPDIRFWLDPGVGTSYGFPSGHAQMAVVFWGWIAWELRKKWAWVFSGVMVLGICLSRIYLGVHDVGDVLGGFIIGLTTLFIFAFFTTTQYKKWTKWWFDLNPCAQTLVMILVVGAAMLSWPGQDLGEFYRYGPFIIGFWLGVRIERNTINYQKHSKVWGQIVASIVGIVGFILLKKAMELGFAIIIPDNGLVMIPRAMILGLYMTAIAPWVLVKMKLANR